MQLHFRLPAITAILAVFFALSIAAPTPDVQIRSQPNPFGKELCELSFPLETNPWLTSLPIIPPALIDAFEACVDCLDTFSNRCALCGLAKTKTSPGQWTSIQFHCNYDPQTQPCKLPTEVPDCVKAIVKIVPN